MAKPIHLNKKIKSDFFKWLNYNYEGNLFGVKRPKIIEFSFDKNFNPSIVFDIKQKEEMLFKYFVDKILITDFFDVKKAEKNKRNIVKRVKKKTGKKIKETDFYISTEWLILKNKVLSLYKCGCMKCGVVGTEKHVDHIFPRSKFKYLEYDIHNLQILCRKCNMEKSNKNTIDYRTSEQKKLCSTKYN